MNIEIVYERLIQSLRLVASKSAIQIISLPNFVDVADEIALIYDEAFGTATLLKDANKISTDVFDKLNELNELFEKMSQDKSLWNISSLEHGQLWEESRILVNSVLSNLGECYSTPDINFLNWIQ